MFRFFVTIFLVACCCNALSATTSGSGKCGLTCSINNDCDTSGAADACSLCKGAASGKVNGTCVSFSNETCGKVCANNNDCGLPPSNETCSSCQNGQCVRGTTCGNPCGGLDTNCDQTSRCDRCVNIAEPNQPSNFICSAGCQQPCDLDDQCLAVADGCTACLLKNAEKQSTCEHFNCGQPCKQLSDCANIHGGLCTQCVGSYLPNGTLVNQTCKAPCGNPCRQQSDCFWPCSRCDFKSANGTCSY